MVGMIEDEELRGLPEPDEAQKAAVFHAFEEEWWRGRISRAGEPGLTSTSCGRRRKGRV